jgi:PAS domain S-box-containing protein
MTEYSTPIETPFFLLDSSGKILNANDVAVNYYGYTRDELLSMNAAELRIPGERPKFPAVLAACFKVSCVSETVHLRKDGSTFEAEVVYNGIIIASVRVVACVVRDMTAYRHSEKEREQVMAQLKNANDELTTILDITGTAMSTLDINELIYSILDRIKTALHTDAGAILLREGENLRLYSAIGLKNKFSPGFTIPIGSGLAGTVAVTGIPRFIRDAQTDPLITSERLRKTGVRSMLAVPMWNRGKIIGVLHVGWMSLHDYQEYEEHILLVSATRCSSAIVNARLFRETMGLKHLSELFLDLMSHDINNMNQIGLGFLEMARDRIESGHCIGKADIQLIDKAREALQNSSLLIGNVKKLQQLHSETLPLVAIDLCVIINDIKNHYSVSHGRMVRIIFEPVPGCYVMANDLLRDVFANLVSNAIKHTPDTCNLIIDIALAKIYEGGNKYFLVTVSDNGPGIPDKLKRKIFTRFQKGVSNAEGKGLGLYLVKTLVEAFCGKVWVEDRVPGDYTKGAKFVVMLPEA